MHRQKRIVITGLGTVNALAKNISGFTKALQEGVCGIGPLDLFDTKDFRTKNGGQIKNFVPREYIPKDFSLKRTSRADQLAFAAALEALRDAVLYPLPGQLKEKVGIAIGGGSGGLYEGENFYSQLLKKGSSRARFSSLSSVYCASSADYIASALGLTGPKTTFMTACSAGGTALGYARDLLVSNHAALMLAGGVEPMCRITYAAFNALQSVDPDVCRPFDRNRAGLSLGEAAAIMVLEPLETALARGAKIYAEILGYGISCDSFHMTAPDEKASGAVRSMQAALKDANLSIDDIDYINAHGTATPVNDATETKAIKEVFGRRAYAIPVSSTKSMHAHTLGAAGALEGIVSVLALQKGFIPPTINYTRPDPLCDLDYVIEGMRKADLRAVLSNSFAFGGNNTTVIFGKYSERGAAHD
ncbi:MAG TPA: beta-ketoacyl-[acyl-carrier-protein] synthase family protein [Smithellaceae bacterium]|nr:beta-ketoacyl-[acyl-carrier-protein] synthase family protein [Smithellaceae bacterium]HRS88099.1 beta-ketoacyl-[acyl-carrier-protein] synthase family protein [Smithellaceae bacterium]HRV25427.1 beta-ketoacyl-[acyl-carrier-protein] synthase family protein [Smithellaceae bacterium]